MWESTKQLVYSLSGHTNPADRAEVLNVLAWLIANCAIENIEGGGVLCIAGWAGNNDQRNVFQSMPEVCFVSKLEGDTDNDTKWCLTSLGAASLQCSRMLAAPKPVASLYHEVSAVEVITAFELAIRLRDEGWTWQRLPRKLCDCPAFAYQADSTKVSYSLSHDVDRHYLACLFNAGVLLEQGAGGIHHGRPPKYYNGLLAGDFQGAALARWPKRQALQLDVEVEPTLPAILDAAVLPAALVDDDAEVTHHALSVRFYVCSGLFGGARLLKRNQNKH